MQLSRGEHEIHMRRRLFQSLEQSVEGLGGQHVHFVYNNNLEARHDRHEADVLFQLADFLNASVGRAVNLVQVNRAASGDFFAGAAGAARLRWLAAFAVESLGHDPGQGGLAGAPHAAKNQGVRHPITQQGVLKGADYVLLADNLGEILRPRLAGKDEVGQGGLFFTNQRR